MKSYNSFAQYLHEIGTYPLLDANQELALGKMIAEGDDLDRQFASNRLANCNLRLVVCIAKTFKNPNIAFEDLVNAGNSGLLTAVQKYNYKLGYRFSTCAVPWIKQAIMKAIADNSRIVRIPAHIIQQFNKYKKVIEDFNIKGIEPTSEQIAAAMKITVEELHQLNQWKLNAISLDTPLGDDTEDCVLGDLYEDENVESPMEVAARERNREIVDGLVEKLDDRTKAIVKLRFGLGVDGDPSEYFEEHTLENIGSMLTPQITRERVRQILVKQLAKWKPLLADMMDY